MRRQSLNQRREEEDREEFDDEFDLEEMVGDIMPREADSLVRPVMDTVKPIMDPVVEQMLPKGIVDVSQEVPSRRGLQSAQRAIHSHFADSNFWYKRLSDDTFKLRIRARRNPLFGSFNGKLTIREHLDPWLTERTGLRSYHVEGLLRYRMSTTWTLAVVAFFLLLLNWTNAGYQAGTALFLVGAGTTIAVTYRMGREERDEAEERVAESFLRLRSTIDNR